MMRRRAALFLAAVLLAVSAPLGAAGTVTVTTTAIGPVTEYKIVWVSTAGGAVSGNAFGVTDGLILAVKFVPDGGGTQPTDLYDVTLVDAHSVDILNAQAADLRNTVGKYFQFTTPFYFSGNRGAQTLDLVIANAGASKGGTVFIWVRTQQ